MSLSISDYNPVKAIGHSAFMDAMAEELSLGKPSVDAVRLDYTGVQIVDYVDGSVANTHYLYPSSSAGVLDLSVAAPLDLVTSTTSWAQRRMAPRHQLDSHSTPFLRLVAVVKPL